MKIIIEPQFPVNLDEKDITFEMLKASLDEEPGDFGMTLDQSVLSAILGFLRDGESESVHNDLKIIIKKC